MRSTGRFCSRPAFPRRRSKLKANPGRRGENAEFTIKLLRAEKIHSAILVTSWYHSRRALKTFEHFAPDLKFYSRPSYFAFDRAKTGRTSDLQAACVWSLLKLPGYWIRYGVNPF